MRGMRRLVAGIVVGVFIGTLLLTPAGAHINKHTKHVIKHLIKHGFVAFKRTVLVSPVGTPAENGAAMLDGIAGIEASAADPWLVKVEPGTYDLGTQTLELPPFVDLEGSGRRNTKISCACSSESNSVPGAGAVILLDPSSELRSLSVLNDGTGDHLHAVDVSGNSGRARITDVEVVVQGSPAFASGIWMGLNAQADIRDTKVRVFGDGATTAWGIRATPGTLATVTDSEVFVSDGDENFGIHAGGSTLKVTDSSVDVQGSSSDNFGVWSRESVVTYTNVTSEASHGPLNEAFHNQLTPPDKPAIMRGIQALAIGGGDRYFAVRNIDADVRIEDSRLVGDGVEGYGLHNRTTVATQRHIAVSNTSITAKGDIIQEGIDVGGPGLTLTQVDNSEVVSDPGRWVRMNGNAFVVIGGTLLRGNQALNQGDGVLKCAGVWDESYDFFPDACPDVP